MSQSMLAQGASTSDDRPHYGNWWRPRSPGIGPLGTIGTAAALCGVPVVFLVLMTAGFLPAAGVAVIVAVVVAAVMPLPTSDGRSVGAMIGARGAHRRNRTRGHYAPGLVAGTGVAVGEQTTRLPGLLAPTRLVTITTVDGHEAGVVVHPRPQQVAAVLEVTPRAGALVDGPVIDQWVEQWGLFLAQLGREPQVVAAQVTVQTSPDNGEKLAAEVERLTTTTGPLFAAQVLREARDQLPAGAATTRSWVTITWARDTGLTRPKSTDQLLAMVADRLPGIAEALRRAGCGRVTPMTSDQVTSVVADAYDPAAAHASPVSWRNAGPEVMLAGWDCLRHAGSWSRVWRMVEAPASAVPSHVLAPLLAAKPGLPIKRVTVTYRPHSAAKAAAVSDRDVRTAKGKATERASHDKATETRAWSMAQQAAMETAAGAGVGRFSLICTVTVPHRDDLEAAGHLVDQVAAEARVRLRPAAGAQAATFTAGLGVGVILASHTTIPAVFRESL